jgi:nicotinate-nucleotide adenylyltransferase
MKGKKIGFFGGTFDPIHYGHIHLALSMLEMNKVDEILFCPAQCSPFKTKEEPIAASEHRKKMIELAIAPIKNFNLIPDELDRPAPSYTIDTVRDLLKRHPYSQMHLILGEDAIETLPSWKEIEELIILAPPLIGTRNGKEKKSFHFLPPLLHAAIEKGSVQIPVMEISSTWIRKRLKMNQYCGHLLPPKVLDYIYEYDLY